MPKRNAGRASQHLMLLAVHAGSQSAKVKVNAGVDCLGDLGAGGRPHGDKHTQDTRMPCGHFTVPIECGARPKATALALAFALSSEKSQRWISEKITAEFQDPYTRNAHKTGVLDGRQ
jgi:hypothetical protein